MVAGGDTTEDEEESDNDVSGTGAKSGSSSSGALLAAVVEHEEVWEDFDEGEVEEDSDEGEEGVGGGDAGGSNEAPRRSSREVPRKGSVMGDSSSEEEEDAGQGDGGAFARALQVGTHPDRDSMESNRAHNAFAAR